MGRSKERQAGGDPFTQEEWSKLNSGRNADWLSGLQNYTRRWVLKQRYIEDDFLFDNRTTASCGAQRCCSNGRRLVFQRTFAGTRSSTLPASPSLPGTNDNLAQRRCDVLRLAAAGIVYPATFGLGFGEAATAGDRR